MLNSFVIEGIIQKMKTAAKTGDASGARAAVEFAMNMEAPTQRVVTQRRLLVEGLKDLWFEKQRVHLYEMDK